MAPTNLAPAAGPVFQIVLSSLPLALVLAYFLWQASRRPFAQCDAAQKAAIEASNGGGMKGYFMDFFDLAIDDCFDPVSLTQMVIIFLCLAQMWGLLCVYVSFFIPRRRRLLKEYLNEGVAVLGDVYYELRTYCFGRYFDHVGHVTYPHPNKDVYPVYVRRELSVLEHFTREQVTILMLPDHPFSGQAKTDLEIDFAAAQRNRRKNTAIACISWIWFAFTLFSPIYILLTMDMVRDENMVAAGDDDSVADGRRAKVISWALYCIFAVLVIPAISIGVNKLAWERYLYQQTRAGRVAEEGDMKSGWFDSHDCDEVTYYPPSVTTSHGAATASVQVKSLRD